MLAAILPAAGQSRRFGGPRSKLLEDLAGRAVIAWAVEAFLARTDLVALVVPTSDPTTFGDALKQARGHRDLDPRVRFCPGGPTRAHSVHNALLSLDDSVEWVAVHDAARPLVSHALIDRTLAAARAHGAAVPAMPVHLTIKQAEGPLPARVGRTIPRDTLWAMQTPQIARREAFLAAYRNCPLPLELVTDDMQLIELAGQEVWLVEGEERNLKITLPLDLSLARALLRGP